MKRAFVVATLCLGLANPALAAVPVQKDQLTVSGRFELAKASTAPLKSSLKISDVNVDASAVKALKGKPEAVDTAVTQALEASLRNFGYLGEAGAAVPVTARLEALEVTTEAESTLVTVKIGFAATGDSEAARCVPAVAEARFKALKPQSSGNGQRAAGVIAMIAFAAAGYNAGQLMMSQFDAAKAQERAINARRVVGQGEGVALSAKEPDMLQFATIHATRLAMADFIRQLGESACAPKTAAPVVAEPAVQIAAPAETPTVTPASGEPTPAPEVSSTAAPAA